MARYIDADIARKKFNQNFGGVSHAVIANQIIDSIPTADAAEVKHGIWIEGKSLENALFVERKDFLIGCIAHIVEQRWMAKERSNHERKICETR